MTEDWDAALTETEGALLSCAALVLDCMRKQEAAHAATR